MPITRLVDLSKYRFNNHVRAVEALTLHVDATPNRPDKYRLVTGSGVGEQAGGIRYIQVGNTLAIGILPRNSVVTNVKVIFNEDFPEDTTFDLGFLKDFPTDDLVVMQADIKADSANVTRYSGVNVSGVVTPIDDTPVPAGESDYRGALWNGNERPLIIGLQVNSPLPDLTDLKKGKCTFIISYVRYDDADINRGEELSLEGNYKRFTRT